MKEKKKSEILKFFVSFQRFFSMIKIKDLKTVSEQIIEKMHGLECDTIIGNIGTKNYSNMVAFVYTVGGNATTESVSFYLLFVKIIFKKIKSLHLILNFVSWLHTIKENIMQGNLTMMS